MTFMQFAQIWHRTRLMNYLYITVWCALTWSYQKGYYSFQTMMLIKLIPFVVICRYQYKVTRNHTHTVLMMACVTLLAVLLTPFFAWIFDSLAGI